MTQSNDRGGPPSPDVADELAAELAAGDTSALGALFVMHRPAFRRLVHFRIDPRVAQRVDPDDVLQEAYLQAEKRIDTFVGEDGLGAFVWLRLLVVQTLTDVHRRHASADRRSVRREAVAPGGQSASNSSLSQRLVASLTSPSQAAMRAEVLAGIEAALDEMDEVDREILMLRHFEELANAEIAAVLGLQPTAASNRYVRALARLRGLLGVNPESKA